MCRLHKDFVFIPVYQAASNYAIVWKLFYINNITNELNISKHFCQIRLRHSAIINKFNAYIENVTH